MMDIEDNTNVETILDWCIYNHGSLKIASDIDGFQNVKGENCHWEIRLVYNGPEKGDRRVFTVSNFDLKPALREVVDYVRSRRMIDNPHEIFGAD